MAQRSKHGSMSTEEFVQRMREAGWEEWEILDEVNLAEWAAKPHALHCEPLLAPQKEEALCVSAGDAGRIPFERIRRITGYLVGTTDRFNDAKRAELGDRLMHELPAGCV